MRIISLQPFATDFLARNGVGLDLVGVTHECEVPKSLGRVAVLTRPGAEQFTYTSEDEARMAAGLSALPLDLTRLVALAPEVVISDVRELQRGEFCAWAEDYLSRLVGSRVRIFDSSIVSLDDMARVLEDIGALVGARADARSVAVRIKGQLMSWGDSFFERCRGKRVVVLSSVDPIVVEDGWISDMIKILGARTLERESSRQGAPITWDEVIAGRPDVVVIAVRGRSLEESIKTLPKVQNLPRWDELPAVKRGEVVFAPGTNLYQPGPRFLKGAAILVSAAAGLESGYITERDEYFKVRFLELHRHRFL